MPPACLRAICSPCGHFCMQNDRVVAGAGPPYHGNAARLPLRDVVGVGSAWSSGDDNSASCCARWSGSAAPLAAMANRCIRTIFPAAGTQSRRERRRDRLPRTQGSRWRIFSKSTGCAGGKRLRQAVLCFSWASRMHKGPQPSNPFSQKARPARHRQQPSHRRPCAGRHVANLGELRWRAKSAGSAPATPLTPAA